MKKFNIRLFLNKLFGRFSETKNFKLQIKKLEKRIEDLLLVNKITRHDLNNDFAVIKSALNIYRGTKNPEMLEEIEKRILESLKFIQEMKALEKNISKKNLELRNLQETIDEVKDKYPDITINISGNARVFADNSIKSVFNNIINNGINHGNANIFDIKIEDITKDHFAPVKIYNNGTRIESEILMKIFEEGVKGKKTGHTGIGLYTVKKNMERYRGSVTIEPNEDGNVCFVLKFKSVR